MCNAFARNSRNFIIPFEKKVMEENSKLKKKKKNEELSRTAKSLVHSEISDDPRMQDAWRLKYITLEDLFLEHRAY